MSVEFKKTGNVICSADGTNENLLKGSGDYISTDSYNMHNYYYDTPPTLGETYTIQIKGTLGDGKTSWGLYNSGGTGGSSSPTVIGTTGSSNYVTKNLYDPDTGIYTAELLWSYGANGNTHLRIYQMPRSVTGVVSEIEWIKLEVGNKPTPWIQNKTDINNATYNEMVGHHFAEGYDAASVHEGSVTAHELIEW